MAKLALLAVLAWLGLRWFESANLYLPSRTLSIIPRTFGLESEEARFQSSDGVALHGWLVPLSSAAPVLVFFHGNAGNVSDRMEKLRLFRSQGFSVLLFDYRGYGLSSGRPDERGTYRDGLAAVEFLERRGVPLRRVAFYGESLGCAVALETALAKTPAALVLDSPFTSTVAMANIVFPWLPARWIVRYRYDNLGKIPRLAAPLLVVHSKEDEIVPYAMGRALFEAAPSPKEFIESRGSHNEGYVDTPGYAEGIGRFLRRHLR